MLRFPSNQLPHVSSAGYGSWLQALNHSSEVDGSQLTFWNESVSLAEIP
jgi:hypothetical protein